MPFPIGTIDNLFHDGDPGTGTPGTVIDAAWLNAVQAAVIALGGAVKTVDDTYAITNNDSVIFSDTEAGDFTLSLPVTPGGTAAGKRFWLKNIGDTNIASIVAADGKTIDRELQLDLAPGDRAEVCYDGANWQTIN